MSSAVNGCTLPPPPCARTRPAAPAVIATASPITIHHPNLLSVRLTVALLVRNQPRAHPAHGLLARAQAALVPELLEHGHRVRTDQTVVAVATAVPRLERRFAAGVARVELGSLFHEEADDR